MSAPLSIFLSPSARAGILFIAIMLSIHPAAAIDNPDGPDYLKAFGDRAQRYETEIAQSADNSIKTQQIGGTYQAFLDAELNKAYQLVLSNLDDARKAQLRTSQKAWLQYRDSEFNFIEKNWTMDSFGSSAPLSKNMYRAAIVRNRVEVLLMYLKNY